MYKKKTKAQKKPVKARVDWEANQELIEAKYIELLNTNRKAPTATQLSEALGMSRQAVGRHLQKLDLKKLVGGNTAKLFANMIIQGLAGAAAKGDVKAAELYFKLVYGSEQSMNIDVTSKGDKLQPTKVSTGDTFEILIPAWQEQIEDINKKLETGRAGRE